MRSLIRRAVIVGLHVAATLGASACQLVSPGVACHDGWCPDHMTCVQMESDASGPPPMCIVPRVCGNSIKEENEACDDGDEVSGDGCSADCRSLERCGNGVLDSDDGEVCDDGNHVSGDGCSADCQSRDSCGNGIVDHDLGEECDDGNDNDRDSCADCQLVIYLDGIQ